MEGFFEAVGDIGIMKSVEHIIECEIESERATSVDDFWQACSLNDEIAEIDKQLETVGVMCDATHDYEVTAVLKNRKPWMLFDAVEWEWSNSDEEWS